MKVLKMNEELPTDQTVIIDFIPDRATKNITCELALELFKKKIPFTSIEDGMCCGYSHTENDDEPHDRCKKCAWFVEN